MRTYLNKSVSQAMAVALFLVAFGNSGCGKQNNEAVLVEPTFEAEGILAFKRPNGETIITIVIELAESSKEQETGLMNRRSLPARGGMLFLSESEKERQFWMKNTPLSLDILFIRSDLTIANIVKRTTPLSAELIKSEGVVRHVLEVRAGFTDRYGIDTTATISWQRREDVESIETE